MESCFKIYLVNLKPFMNKAFFDNWIYNLPHDIDIESDKLLICNQLPQEYQIIFRNEKSSIKFVELITNKTYAFTNLFIDFKLSSIKENNQVEKMKELYIFKNDYTTDVKIKYERTLKEGGLIFKDEKTIEIQKKVISYLIKKLSSSLFNSKESIMNISLPVTIFDERTLLQV